MIRHTLAVTGFPVWEYEDLAGFRASLVAQSPGGGYYVWSTIEVDVLDDVSGVLFSKAAEFARYHPGQDLLVAHPEIDGGNGIYSVDIAYGRETGSIYRIV